MDLCASLPFIPPRLNLLTQVETKTLTFTSANWSVDQSVAIMAGAAGPATLTALIAGLPAQLGSQTSLFLSDVYIGLPPPPPSLRLSDILEVVAPW